MNDTNLGQRFISGGEAELETIIDLYGEKLLRYATAILCDYQDAENVVQDVFLIAYQNRSSFDGTNLPAWLYKITYHRSINQLKKRKSLWLREISFDQLDKEPFSPALSGNGLGSEALMALSKLKPKERALLYARIMEGQSYNEIAYSTGSSPAALRKQYERAKNKMADYLTTEYQRKELPHEFS
ncbi:RNA polymerase sigma factor [Clostridiales bacterium COT073_COT-073]|nr:RNA polymerase sigma factor [Clostridiales bacterium COT073_COT-073]